MYNPSFDPTISISAQAYCLTFSSWVWESLPLCFAERNSISAGVKYGRKYLDEDEGTWDGEGERIEVAAFDMVRT